MRACIDTGTAIISARLIFILISGADISSADILHDIPKHNPLHIFYGPAPSPEDGPPLSRGASRNRALLPGQIGGIFGAYFLCIGILGIGVFFARRRLRRQTLVASKAKDIEMLESNKPGNISITVPPTSPKSPGRNFSYPGQEKSGVASYVNPAKSPRSPASPYSPKTPSSLAHSEVDPRIVERDQQIMGRDLEDIYAHVMEQEEAKAAGVSVTELPLPSKLQSMGPVPTPAPQRGSTVSKKSERHRPTNIEVDDSQRNSKTGSRASSIISSLISPRKSNSTFKNLRISSPMASPKSARWQNERGTEEENEPLTPRFYAPPPPPPVPKDQAPYAQTRKQSVESMTLQSPTRSIAEQLEPYGPGAKSIFHKSNPSQASFASQRTLPQADPVSAVSAKSNSSVPWSSNASVTESSRNLPLRQFEPAITSPSYVSFAQSTKTTVLERTAGANRGPQTGGLNTPWSAGAVPYSPYQPFTPMIPITPRLVTREERKMKERMERKQGLSTPRIADDMVKSSNDMWDSGY